MSEQQKPKSFMQELDDWTDEHIIEEVWNTDPNQDDWGRTVERVKRAIREKVLESYRNGQNSGPRRTPTPVSPPAGYQASWRRSP